MNSRILCGLLLKQLRIKHGLKQTQFAERIPISQPYLAELEIGKKPLKEETLKEIDKAFKLTEKEKELFTCALNGTWIDIPTEFAPLEKLYFFLLDELIPTQLKHLVEENISNLIDGWSTVVYAQLNNNKRRWNDVLTACNQGLEQVLPHSAFLSTYLYEMQAEASIHLGKLAQAIAILETTEKEIPSLNNQDIKAIHCINRGDVLRYQGYLEEAEKQYNEARSVYDRLGKTLFTKQVERKIATLFLFRGNWHAARPILESCLHTFEQTQSYLDIIQTKYALGWVYSLSGNWDLAHRNHEAGFEIAKKHLEDDPGFQYLTMLGYSYLSNDYRQLDQVDTAIKMGREAQKLGEEFKNDLETGWVLVCLARAIAQKSEELVVSGETDKAAKFRNEARHYFEEALSFYKRNNYAFRLMISQVHYGRFLLNQAPKIEEAEAVLTDALTRASSIHCEYYVAQVKSILCELYRRQERFDEIFYYVQEVEELAGHYHFYRTLARLKATLASAEIDQGLHSNAPILFAQAFHFAILYNELSCHEIEKVFVGNLQQIREIQDKELKKNKAIVVQHQKEAEEVCDKTILALESELKVPKFYDSKRKGIGNALLRRLRRYLEDVQLQRPFSV